MVTWHTGIDWDDDGFICWDTQPGDALNLLPTPVNWGALNVLGENATVTMADEATRYGLRRARVVTTASVFAGGSAGGSFGTVKDTIPVQGSTQYTAAVWVRGAANFEGVSFQFNIRDQDNNSIGFLGGIELTSEWTRISRTFTTGADDTFIYIRFLKNNDAALVTFDLTGYMLVEGNDLPDGFNTGDSSNAADNLTNRVYDLQWRLGFERAYETATAATATVVVENRDAQFSPESTSDALTRGKLVVIDSDDGSTRRRHYTGLIDHIEVTPGEQGKRQATLHLTGIEQQLAEHPVHIAPGIDITADEAIRDVLNQVRLRPARLKFHWVIGITGNSEVGQAMIVAESEPVMLESGHTVLAYVGDTWGSGIPALEALQAIAETERGRLFTNRDGQLVFYNRHHTLLDSASLVTFTDNMDGLDYAFGDAVVNQVEVQLIPRRVGAPGTVLWTSDQIQEIKRRETLDIMISFRDDNDTPVGALLLESLVPHNDYIANRSEDGSGEDVTAFVHIALIERSFSAARLRVRNLSGRKLFLQPGMQLRGTPLHHGNPIRVTQRDATSITRFGLRRWVFTLPALTNIESADQLVRYELARRKDPRGVVGQMTLAGLQHSTQQLTRTLFDRITITEAHTGHSADYFIIAETHHVRPGSARHHTTWLLESANASAFWIVDTSTLDETTIPAY